MFNFTPLDTYDKTEPKVLKQQLDAAYHLGTGGTEVNQAATEAMNKAKADVAALTRVQRMFAKLPLNDKLHKRISYQLTQENKWLAHHTKCVDTTKKGFEKMKAAAKAAGLIDEAFEAGKLEKEKELKAKKNEGNLQSKTDDKNGGKQIDPKFQQRDGEQRKDNNNQNQNQNPNDKHKEQGKSAPVTLVIENLVVAKGKKAKKYAGHSGFVQRKSN